MKEKGIKWFLLISILIFPSLNILFESEELSIKYVAIVISVATTLFSVLFYRIVYIFLLKIFNLYDKSDELYLVIILYVSIFVNTVLAFVVNGSAFEPVVMINPGLLFTATFFYYHFQKSSNKRKQGLLFYTTFYLINIIGVLLTLGVK